MLWRPVRTYILMAFAVMLLPSLCMAAPHHLGVRGNRITLDGRRGQILYRDCGDLDRDGKKETVMSARIGEWQQCWVVVARRIGGRWRLVTQEEAAWYLRTDVSDVNGDGKLEIIARMTSGDGHGLCTIYRFENGQLVELGHFGKTKFRDLSGDGVSEVLGLSMISAGFVGDHWLTIYKWNGQGYTDVSRRFPQAYDSVIRDLKRTIYEMRYTKSYGQRITPKDAPDIFSDLYHYLGQAFEYRGSPAKAKIQYAIADRLDAETAAIRQTHPAPQP